MKPQNFFIALTAVLIVTSTGVVSRAKDTSHVTRVKTVAAKPAGQSAEVQWANYSISPSKAVVMNLAGTTAVKDWSMTATGLLGNARMLLAQDNTLAGIDGMTFSLPVHNLKGEVRAMDEDAYEALKADRYREITFKLSSATIDHKGGREYAVAAKGSLSVAGVTRNVTLSMRSRVERDGSISFSGAEELKMSDYNVEPPSLLFGAIKARDKMTLTYTLIFTRQEPQQ